MTHLALEGVGFVYPDGTRALSDVDLEVAPGEQVAIVEEPAAVRCRGSTLCRAQH